MVIKEGSIIKILDMNDISMSVVGKIKAVEDISIEDNDRYTFLLRHRDCKENCIFESEKIYIKDDEYVVEGYFKDAILVVSDKYGIEMHESYMSYDN